MTRDAEIREQLARLREGVARVADALTAMHGELCDLTRLIEAGREADNARAADVERRLHRVEGLCGVLEAGAE
jgi:hypothetical protein